MRDLVEWVYFYTAELCNREFCKRVFEPLPILFYMFESHVLVFNMHLFSAQIKKAHSK